jgi:multiple sugar transport system permease protein
MSRGKGRWFRHLVILALAYAFLHPLAVCFFRSTQPPPEARADTYASNWIEQARENFGTAFRYGMSERLQAASANWPVWKLFWCGPFSGYFINTLTVAVLGVAGIVLSSSMVAYGFARIRWPGREVFFYVTLATMMLPFAVTMIPLYGVFRDLGWIGTLKPLWAPAWFANAFNIFLLRQFYRRIPDDLTEAARIDGCNEWQIFTQIILPLSKPVLAVVALFHLFYTWNDFLGPLIFLTEPKDFTISLGLQYFASRHGGVSESQILAAAAIVVAPMILVFFVAQRFFTEGVATTGIKG